MFVERCVLTTRSREYLSRSIMYKHFFSLRSIEISIDGVDIDVVPRNAWLRDLASQFTEARKARWRSHRDARSGEHNEIARCLDGLELWWNDESVC
jgi:hypothetical protein